jgi:hypothetical protein
MSYACIDSISVLIRVWALERPAFTLLGGPRQMGKLEALGVKRYLDVF